MRTFLKNLPIPRKLALIVILFSIVIIKLLLLAWPGQEVLSGSRAYVGGEGLWSKAQKSAVYQLTRYALYHDEADYRKYPQYIAVSQGESRGRGAN